MTSRTRTALVPGPTVTIELSGGDHLHEFTSVWLKAVRGFDPRFESHHCLRGPYLRVHGERVPPMNVPAAYVLPADTTAVYVHGKSAAGAAHDIHAALVPAAGDKLVLPLTVATEEKRRDVARLARLLSEQQWVVASTMPENPHEYTPRKTWADDAEFEFAVRAIRRYGHREKYIPPGAVKAAYTETVFASGSHFVWSGWQPPEITGWINRKPLASPTTACVADQTLAVHDARILPIPDLPDGFGGLPDATTRCRFFQAGVKLFGYVAPDSDVPGCRKEG